MQDNSLNRCASMLSSVINAGDVVTTLNIVALMITVKMSYYLMVSHNVWRLSAIIALCTIVVSPKAINHHRS